MDGIERVVRIYRVDGRFDRGFAGAAGQDEDEGCCSRKDCGFHAH